MQWVAISFLLGVIFLILGKRLWDRGRGGQMTRDSIVFGLLGLAALVYSLILFLALVFHWVDSLLTKLANWVNSLLPFTLSKPLALFLVFGTLCFLAGGMSIALFYLKVWIQRKRSFSTEMEQSS